MTEEELEKEYYGRRPTEPYSEDDNPNDWAIVKKHKKNFLNAYSSNRKQSVVRLKIGLIGYRE